MTEDLLLKALAPLFSELVVYAVAIWATTWAIGRALPRISNRLVGVIVAFVYGVGAYTAHYLQGDWFAVILIKTPIAWVMSMFIHEKIVEKILKKDIPEATAVVKGTITGTGNGSASGKQADNGQK